MTGKSYAQIVLAQARCSFDRNTRIGVTCEKTYNLLIANGIPEDNLVKMWMRKEAPIMWFDEEAV